MKYKVLLLRQYYAFRKEMRLWKCFQHFMTLWINHILWTKFQSTASMIYRTYTDTNVRWWSNRHDQLTNNYKITRSIGSFISLWINVCTEKNHNCSNSRPDSFNNFFFNNLKENIWLYSILYCKIFFCIGRCIIWEII